MDNEVKCPGCRGILASEGFPIPIHVEGLCTKKHEPGRVLGVVNIDRERGIVTFEAPDGP